MLGGINLFWRPGLFWTQLLAGCLFLHTAEMVLMSEELAWGHGKWKHISHLDGRRAGDGPDGRKQKAGCALGTPSVLFPRTRYTPSLSGPRSVYSALAIARSCSGSMGSSKDKADRHTLSRDVLMEQQ